MTHTRICADYGRWPTEVFTAMRQHESGTIVAGKFNRDGDLTKEGCRELAPGTFEPFNLARLA